MTLVLGLRREAEISPAEHLHLATASAICGGKQGAS